MEKELFTLKEIAALRKVSKVAVWTMIKRKKIPTVKIGNLVLVKKENLAMFEK